MQVTASNLGYGTAVDMYVLKTPDQHLLVPVGRANLVDVRRQCVQSVNESVHLAASAA